MARNALALILAVAILVLFVPRPWINPTLFYAGLFLLGGASAIALIIHPRRLRFAFPIVPLAFAAAWGWLQLAAHWTTAPAGTRLATLAWCANLVAFCLALRHGRRLLDALLYFAFALSVVAVVQYFSGVERIFWLFPTEAPAWGPFVNRDQYAAFIELVLPLALMRALGGRPHAFRFAIVSAAMYASVIAGASRAGAILTTAEIVCVQLWGCLRPGSSKSETSEMLGVAPLQPPFGAPVAVPQDAAGQGRDWLPQLASVSGAAIFIAVAGCGLLFHRFSDPDPFGGRREILQGTFAMIHARPWTGFGLGTFRTAYPAYSPLDFGAAVNHAHNDWAEWAADGGIPFSLMLAAMAVWSVPKAWRSVWGIGIVAVFVHGLVDFPLQIPALQLWLFTLLGVLAAQTISIRD